MFGYNGVSCALEVVGTIYTQASYWLSGTSFDAAPPLSPDVRGLPGQDIQGGQVAVAFHRRGCQRGWLVVAPIASERAGSSFG